MAKRLVKKGFFNVGEIMEPIANVHAQEERAEADLRSTIASRLANQNIAQQNVDLGRDRLALQGQDISSRLADQQSQMQLQRELTEAANNLKEQQFADTMGYNYDRLDSGEALQREQMDMQDFQFGERMGQEFNLAGQREAGLDRRAGAQMDFQRHMAEDQRGFAREQSEADRSFRSGLSSQEFQQRASFEQARLDFEVQKANAQFGQSSRQAQQARSQQERHSAMTLMNSEQFAPLQEALTSASRFKSEARRPILNILRQSPEAVPHIKAMTERMIRGWQTAAADKVKAGQWLRDDAPDEVQKMISRNLRSVDLSTDFGRETAVSLLKHPAVGTTGRQVRTSLQNLFSFMRDLEREMPAQVELDVFKLDPVKIDTNPFMTGAGGFNPGQ